MNETISPPSLEESFKTSFRDMFFGSPKNLDRVASRLLEIAENVVVDQDGNFSLEIPQKHGLHTILTLCPEAGRVFVVAAKKNEDSTLDAVASVEFDGPKSAWIPDQEGVAAQIASDSEALRIHDSGAFSYWADLEFGSRKRRKKH